jgi:hypothetical protein
MCSHFAHDLMLAFIIHQLSLAVFATYSYLPQSRLESHLRYHALDNWFAWVFAGSKYGPDGHRRALL